MKKGLKFLNPEVQAEVPSRAPASKTWDRAIVTNWLLCCVAGRGGLYASPAARGRRWGLRAPAAGEGGLHASYPLCASLPLPPWACKPVAPKVQERQD